MPGVPSSRACEACKKQKKKCDQSKPTCSRCTRLLITCTGSGEQQYKFKKWRDPSNSIRIRPLEQLWSTKEIPRNLSNETTIVAGAFVSMLAITDLTLLEIPSYGRFFKDIPRRLGESEALTAAVSALAIGFPSLRTHEVTPEMLKQYGRALKTLRKTLADPVEAQTADTLCSIYLITLCQKFFWKRGDPYLGHGEAMAHILNSRLSRGSNNGFMGDFIITVGVTVLLEMVLSPKIYLNPNLWNLNEIFGPANNYGGSIEALTLKVLAVLPRYIQDPESYLFEIRTAYRKIQKELPSLCRRLGKTREITLSIHVPVMRLYSSCLLLALAILFNDILYSFDPYDDLLVEEATFYKSELLVLAEEVTRGLPLGAAYIPVCLISIWATTENSSTQARVEEILAEYQAVALNQSKWFDIAIWTKNRLRRLHMTIPPHDNNV